MAADMTFKANLIPNTSLGYSLGSDEKRWNIYGNLHGNADTATKLSNTPNNTTVFLRGDNTWTNKLNGSLHLYGQAYGNTASDMLSGTAGVFSWGDKGPQITFDSVESPGGNQAGALIFTDHDAAGAGVSWHFVSNQGDWNVNSKRFVAKTSITIGQNLPNTSYPLYVNGTSYLNGNLYMPATSGIYTIGNKATYRIIRFMDNTEDTYGNGISIGGGGPTIIGGGESADVMANHNGNNGYEIMNIGNDGNIDFYTNLQNGWDSGKHFYMDTGGHFRCPGYVYANYYNASCGAETPSNASYWIYSNSDGFFRKSSLGNLFNLIRDNGGDSRWVTLTTNQNIT